MIKTFKNLTLAGVALTLVFMGCQKQVFHDEVIIIGHGGTGIESPNSLYHDNSEEDIRAALNTTGLDAVEIDVQVSLDGDLWAFHDNKLEDATDFSGCIHVLNSAEIEGATYKSLQKEKIYSLEEADMLWRQEKKIYLDIKQTNFCDSVEADLPRFLAALNRFRSHFDNPDQVEIIVIAETWIEVLLEEGWKVHYCIDDLERLNQALDKYPELTGICIRSKAIKSEEVRAFQKAGYQVMMYGINTPKGAREARKKRPNSVITDDVIATIIEMNR